MFDSLSLCEECHPFLFSSMLFSFPLYPVCCYLHSFLLVPSSLHQFHLLWICIWFFFSLVYSPFPFFLAFDPHLVSPAPYSNKTRLMNSGGNMGSGGTLKLHQEGSVFPLKLISRTPPPISLHSFPSPSPVSPPFPFSSIPSLLLSLSSLLPTLNFHQGYRGKEGGPVYGRYSG